MTLTDSTRDRRHPPPDGEGGGVRVGPSGRRSAAADAGSDADQPGARLAESAGSLLGIVRESLWARAALAGFGAALLGWLVLTALATFGWLTAAGSTSGWSQVLSVTSGAWFLAHGATVTAAGTAAAAGVAGTAATAATPAVAISLTPLGLLALIAALDHLVIGRALRRLAGASTGTRFDRGLLRQVVPALLAGYLVAAWAIYAIAARGPFRPSAGAALLAVGVPAVVLVVALVRRSLAGEGPASIGALIDRLPLAVRRGVRPGLIGLGALVAAGALVLVVAVIARFSTVTGLYNSLGVGAVDGTLLTVGQLAFLPNLAGWGLSVLAGPGFQVATGSTISLSGAAPGLLPIVPVFGALPDAGPFPAWLRVLMLVPVACGVLIGWQACGAYSRLAGWRARLSVCLVAVVVAVSGLAVFTALGVGSLGVGRLTGVGPSIGPLLAWVTGELVVGVAGFLLVDQVRRRLGR